MPAALGAKPNRSLPAQEVLHLITHPVRWAILEVLKGSMSAGEIAEAVDLRSANVQYHLKELAKVGIVDEFPLADHKRVFRYSRATVKGYTHITPLKASAVVHYE